ncbi:MAG: beta-lactamase family protein [Gammaproteobacteria bacterium]|nr:beta-lactamase family protein [Gammaproteobacteria bacterium]
MMRFAIIGVAGLILAALLLLLWWLDPRLPAAVAPQDHDGSGALSREQAGPLLRLDFDRIDRDGSGDLDGRELRRYILGNWLAGRSRAVPVPAFPEHRDEGALRRWLDEAVAAGHVSSVGMILVRDGEVLFEHHAGEFDPRAPLPLDSAGMWPAAVMVGCLAERGEVDLDAPLGRLDGRLGQGWGSMTAGGILAHVAGAPAVSGTTFPPETGLETAARALMARYPALPPDRELRFGGAGLQVLAGLIEARMERSWRRLFVECLGWPLSLDSASLGHPVTGPSAQGFLSPGFGLHMGLKDYGRFLAMLQQQGRYDGVGIIDRRTIAQLERERVGALPRVDRPHWADPAWGHAAGAWCELRDEVGQCRRLSAPGAYGALPWLDRDRRLAGVILTVDSLPRIRDWLFATRELAEQTHFGRR